MPKARNRIRNTNGAAGLPKTPTGISGLDDVRRLPPPVKRIIGDLSNAERVLVGLDVQPAAETA